MPCMTCGSDRRILRVTDCATGTITEICSDCFADRNAPEQAYPIAIDALPIADQASALIGIDPCVDSTLADLIIWARAFADHGTYSGIGNAVTWSKGIVHYSPNSADACNSKARRIWARPSMARDIIRAELVAFADRLAESVNVNILEFASALRISADNITATPVTEMRDSSKVIRC